jgi:hypothetical protein
MDCPHPKSKGAKRCKSCSAKFMATDPKIQRKRREGIQRYHQQPGVKLEYRERMRKALAASMADPAQLERRREHGRWLRANVLTRPDVVEKTLAPETRAKRAKSLSSTRMRDIPAAYRDEYRRLVDGKKASAAEAKAMILEQFKRDMRAA